VRHGGEGVGVGVEREGRGPDMHGGVEMEIQQLRRKRWAACAERVEFESEPACIGDKASRR
jgi:hypothetical protein